MAAGKTYIKIASQTLSGSSSSFSFSNLPQNYTDLVLVIDGIASTEASDIMQFNADGGSNYSWTEIEGTPASSRGSNQTSCYLGNTYTARYLKIINIFNYSNSTTYKTVISRSNYQAGTYAVSVWLSAWRSTNAITSFTVGPNSGTMSSGTTATLYGIAAQKAPKAIGGTITTDGSYWIHTYTSSGLFTPQESIDNVDYLVVAGGGGGSTNGQGGGGAGGLRSTVTSTGGGGSIESKLFLLKGTSHTITVGGGGTTTTQGSNSVFSTITSIGGGAGTGRATGGSGGSGGGAGEIDYVTPQTGGSGTNNQGYNGGTGGGTKIGAGGGGGAGAVGGAGSSSSGGAGGTGVATSISGSSVTYAGGGGGGGYSPSPYFISGGAGGSGGGGAGGTSFAQAGTAGTTNTGGGGGGGAGASGTGAAGGSGVVIVRYPV